MLCINEKRKDRRLIYKVGKGEGLCYGRNFRKCEERNKYIFIEMNDFGQNNLRLS